MLREGRAKLEGIVREQAREAVAANDHANVVRYVRLCRPLRLQQEGLDLLLGYLRGLISERAKADYDALVDGFAAGGAGAGRPVCFCIGVGWLLMCRWLCGRWGGLSALEPSQHRV